MTVDGDKKKIDQLRALLNVSDAVTSEEVVELFKQFLGIIVGFEETVNQKFLHFIKEVSDEFDTHGEKYQSISKSQEFANSLRLLIKGTKDSLRTDISDLKSSTDRSFRVLVERIAKKADPLNKAELISELLELIPYRKPEDLVKALESLKGDSRLSKDAIKDLPPSVNIFGGDGPAVPFEPTLKEGANITIRKDASGAFVISSTGGTSNDFIDNEIVDGSSTSWTLAHTPIAGSVHVFGGGSRLTLGTDYTISGQSITTTYGYDAGQVVADYRTT